MREKTSKVNQIIAIIKRTFDYMDPIQIFKTLVKSHLEYASTGWAPYELDALRQFREVPQN